MENVVAIGYTKKPHGLKGEIKLQVEERFIEDLMNTEVIVLDIKGKKVPFFVEDVRVGNNIIAKFEDVNTPDAALSIAGKELFLRESDILDDSEREIEIEVSPFADCVGYAIVENGNVIGTIEEIAELPQSDMAILTINEKEVLIPLNDAFVKKIDARHKQIVVELPEGLLDLYI